MITKSKNTKKQNMLKRTNLSLSELVALKIANQLTNHMEYKSTKAKYEKQRNKRVKQYSVEYAQEMLNNLTNLQKFQAHGSSPGFQESETFPEKNRYYLNKRLNTCENDCNTFKEMQTQKSNNYKGLTKKNIKVFQDRFKGLIKLNTEEEQNQNFSQIVEKMRQRKIRYAQAMSMFVEQSNQKIKTINDTQNTKKNSFTNSTQRQKSFITTFSGEKLIPQKTPLNLKKDSLYKDKNKIIPIFRVKEYVGTSVDVDKPTKILAQPKRSSIMKNLQQPNLVKSPSEHAPLTATSTFLKGLKPPGLKKMLSFPHNGSVSLHKPLQSNGKQNNNLTNSKVRPLKVLDFGRR